ncbi:methylmalonyl-CoA mutase family protein [Nakamurella sp. A5-74]|uniref:Methylmalonyl-CoA mutase family protein n=1 Tax=Nakamurella sp. A5-74 TaxID=3158264 RepID=A0AAU8DNA2_9ACTN
MSTRTTQSSGSADHSAAVGAPFDEDSALPAGPVLLEGAAPPPPEPRISTPVELEPPTVTSGSYPQWIDAAAGVLRKAKRLPADSSELPADELAPLVIKTLARTTGDGVLVPPLGRSSDVADDLPAGRRSPRVGSWDIRSLVTVADPELAAATALAELEGGATSLVIGVGGAGTDPSALAAALAPVLLDIAAVVLDPVPGSEVAAAQAFSAALRDRGVAPAAGTSFGVDPVGALLDGHAGSGEGDHSFLPEVLALAHEFGVGAVTIDGTRVHELGGGDVTEIGWSIAAGIATLRSVVGQGRTPAEAAGLISFRYAVTDDQFGQIAKLRAARAIWSRVLELSGVDPIGHPQYQHAVTSRPMTSRYDPWVNLLRGTVATFAAGVGGAQAVTTLPFDTALGLPDAFGRRIARNVSHLLVGESRVAEVADPAGGAAAVEQLTDALAQAAWAFVQQLETAGGADTEAAVALVRERATTERAERDALIATRKLPLTGVSEFPHIGETLPTRAAGEPYDRVSWHSAYEDLRDKPCATPVFLATLGPVAAHATRAGFITSALAAVGIGVVLGGPTTDAAAVVAGFTEASTPVAVLVGTDDAYAQQGTDTIAALRAAGATTVLLAGKPPAALTGSLDGSIAFGDDIPALGRTLRTALEGNTA